MALHKLLLALHILILYYLNMFLRLKMNDWFYRQNYMGTLRRYAGELDIHDDNDICR